MTAMTDHGSPRRAGRVPPGPSGFKGRELLGLSEGELNRIRGGGMAMIFQDASTALNPVFRVGWQIEEAIMLHQVVGRARGPADGARGAAHGQHRRARAGRRAAIPSRSRAACSSAR